MSFVAWNALLWAGKWVMIGFVYLALGVILFAVRREMAQRLRSLPSATIAAGRLRVIDPGGDPQQRTGQILPLRPETSLGASSDNDLVLQDPFISGHHTRLEWDGAGWWVEDLGSRNGTFVNGARCTPGDRLPLPIHGILSLGDMTFELLEA